MGPGEFFSKASEFIWSCVVFAFQRVFIFKMELALQYHSHQLSQRCKNPLTKQKTHGQFHLNLF